MGPRGNARHGWEQWDAAVPRANVAVPRCTDRGVPGLEVAAGCAVDANARLGAAGGESIATRQACEGI